MPLVFPVVSEIWVEAAICSEEVKDLREFWVWSSGLEQGFGRSSARDPFSALATLSCQSQGLSLDTVACQNGRDPILQALFMLSIVASWILGPLLAIYTLLFVLRIFLSWYPQLDTSRLPYSWVVGATEFLLQPTRKLIPPLGGVDMAPVVWVGLVTLLREILLGQQGLLTMALH